MKKIQLKDARITFLVSEAGATIEFYDADACVAFAKATITPDQLCQAMSRLMHTSCKIEVRDLDKIGKTMESKEFVFEMPSDAMYKSEQREIAAKLAKKACPEGWIPDTYFNSQNSFFTNASKHMARCIIRRWV